VALDWIKQHAKQVGIAIVALAACGFAAYSVTKGTQGGPRPVGEGTAYFSTDDGNTWFEAPIKNHSPFEKDGKQAYRAFVWRQGKGEPFVSHLMRSGAAAQPAQRDPNQVPSAADRRTVPTMSSSGIEVKRPGEKTWVRASSREGEAIMKIKGPNGTTDELEPIEP
jgi:hypothetical protein